MRTRWPALPYAVPAPQAMRARFCGAHTGASDASIGSVLADISPYHRIRRRGMNKMEEKVWAEVDRYVTATIPHNDAALDGVAKANAAAGLPAIDVSAPQGKLLHLFAL